MLTSTALSLPMASMIPLLIPFAYDVCFANLRRGMFHFIFWFIVTALFVGFMSSLDYIYSENIINGKYFANDQFKLIKSSENLVQPVFNILRNYIYNYLFIAIASLVSGGLLAIFIIGILLNNFAYYLSVLLESSHNKLGTILTGFYIWDIISFLSYFAVTLAFASYFLSFIFDFEVNKRMVLKYFLLSLLFLFLSIFFRVFFSKPWQTLILKTVDVNKVVVLNVPDDIRTTTSFQFYRR